MPSIRASNAHDLVPYERTNENVVPDLERNAGRASTFDDFRVLKSNRLEEIDGVADVAAPLANRAATERCHDPTMLTRDQEPSITRPGQIVWTVIDRDFVTPGGTRFIEPEPVDRAATPFCNKDLAPIG